MDSFFNSWQVSAVWEGLLHSPLIRSTKSFELDVSIRDMASRWAQCYGAFLNRQFGVGSTTTLSYTLPLIMCNNTFSWLTEPIAFLLVSLFSYANFRASLIIIKTACADEYLRCAKLCTLRVCGKSFHTHVYVWHRYWYGIKEHCTDLLAFFEAVKKLVKFSVEIFRRCHFPF